MAESVIVFSVYACSMLVGCLLFFVLGAEVRRLHGRVSRIEGIVFGEGWPDDEYWSEKDDTWE